MSTTPAATQRHLYATFYPCHTHQLKDVRHYKVVMTWKYRIYDEWIVSFEPLLLQHRACHSIYRASPL
jgi:hypothetical protein